MSSDRSVGGRRSIRLPGYNYAQPGAYFVTICTHGGECVLGDVVDGEMILTDWGHVVVESWEAIPAHFQNVETNAFVVMPNHVHGVLVIAPDRRGTACRAPTTTESFGKPVSGSLPTIIRYSNPRYQSASIRVRARPQARSGQRNYYEHVIRTDRAMHAIRRYIAENHAWHLDKYNAMASGPDPLAMDLWHLLKEGGTEVAAPTPSSSLAEHVPRPWNRAGQPHAPFTYLSKNANVRCMAVTKLPLMS